ncbi:MAG: bifunctional folylpolyglutamate synthase/dihydrofolate synthase [Hominisplanchenecus sp.]|nr:folylpolyglutamate synthase/dihydrofolate synthase family protein [Lachnospiraceae bacterium]
MNYTEAVEYILSVPKFTKKNKMENTVELMERLGRPERGMKVIHVAGTNGKGSVCAFLSTMLVKAGKQTGLFTSPHLVKINERFQINNEPVGDEDFLAAYRKVQAAVDAMQKDGFAHPTYFELLFALAMVLFSEKQMEYVVLETGLGGRLDATNMVEKPIATVITSISLDHTEILGDTIEQIAFEKAGIIKPHVPVIYDGHCKQAEHVILERAKELDAPAYGLHEDMYEILANTEKSIDFSLNCGYYEHTGVTVPYLAHYQVINSALALLAMDVIDEKREISIETRVSAIGETTWQGRMETVMPGVVFDGAHNADGVREFVRTVQRVQKERRVTLLFSAVMEKDYEKMIQTICEQTSLAHVVVTEIAGDRNVPAQKLAEVFRSYTKAPVAAVPVIADAFAEALKERQDGILFCVGSLYLVGELKGLLESGGK